MQPILSKLILGYRWRIRWRGKSIYHLLKFREGSATILYYYNQYYWLAGFQAAYTMYLSQCKMR
jgi:hypothetical protein